MHKIINYFNLYYYNAARSVVFPKWSDTYGDYYINTMYCRIGCAALVKTICINDKLKSCDSSITIINGGRLSVISVGAFSDYFNKIGGYREHSSFQVNSKLRDDFSGLIKSKYNTTNSKSVVSIYNRL